MKILLSIFTSIKARSIACDVVRPNSENYFCLQQPPAPYQYWSQFIKISIQLEINLTRLNLFDYIVSDEFCYSFLKREI